MSIEIEGFASKRIHSIEDARVYLSHLIEARLMYHLDDDVDNILWDKNVSKSLLGLIKKRDKELWDVGNPWEYADSVITAYLRKDLTG